MKQSSIEWIYNNLKSHFEHDGDLLEAVKMSFEQAKAMHKEEIENAHIEGQRVFDDYPHTQWTTDQAELYYEKTFEPTKEKWTSTT